MRAQASPVADARAALRADDPEGARVLAEQAVQAAPDDADARIVLGLALYALEQPAQALAAFDAALARSGAAPPAALLSNRGACLSALGRHGEAERAYLAAAQRAQTPLDALAMLNAGFAALDAGALSRAAQHLARARVLDPSHALGEELADLQHELADHATARDAVIRAALDRGDLEGAERAVTAARSEAPDDAAVLYLAGITAYRQGERARAERRFLRALALGLDGERAHIAREYLDLIASGLWLAGRGPSADVELSAGYDSNAAQAGVGDANPLLTQAQNARGSPFARAHAQLAYGLATAETDFVVASYELEQLAYSAATLDDFNVQEHQLALEAEHRLPFGLRLSALARGLFDAIGLSQLRPFSFGAGAELGLAIDHPRGFRTRLVPSWLYTAVLDDGYAFLLGTRLELALEERYTGTRLRAGVQLSWREQNLGTERVATAALPAMCVDCSAQYVIPVGYYGPRAALWASYPLAEVLRLGARVAGELRSHHAPTYLSLSSPLGFAARADARYERERRVSVGLDLALDLVDPLQLTLDYELTVARSNVNNTLGGEHALDYANLSFARHVIALGLSATF